MATPNWSGDGEFCVAPSALRGPEEWKYGYNISRSTGLKSGTLYPILMRLADRSLLETAWETAEAGRPPRHMYKLTADGLRYARTQATAEDVQFSNAQPAFSGGKA